jgi:hypothetical protein
MKYPVIEVLEWLNSNYPTDNGKNHCFVIHKDTNANTVYYWINDKSYYMTFEENDYDIELVIKDLQSYIDSIE